MYSLIHVDMNILNAATLVRLHPGNFKKVEKACIHTIDHTFKQSTSNVDSSRIQINFS